MMNKKYFPLFLPFLLFLIFLIDGQISTFLTNFLPDSLVVSSYLIVVFTVLSVSYIPLFYGLFLYILLGFLYDISHFGIIGVAILLLPLFYLFIYWVEKKMHHNGFTRFILLIIVLFLLEIVGFLIARLSGLTKLSLFLFVSYDLVPSLVVNSLCFLLLQPVFQRNFKITNKT